MKNWILMAVFAAAQALTAGASAAELNFDGAASGFRGSFAELAASAPALPQGPIRGEMADRGGKWTSCQRVDLDYRDGNSISRKVDLSRNYPVQVCEDVTVTNSQGQYVTANQCHTEYEFYSASAYLIINKRFLREGEKERIEVCYDFQTSRGSFRLLGSPFAYTYTDKQNPPNASYSVELFPGERKPQAPAAGALEYSSFSYDDVRGVFTLKLKSRFGTEYQGRLVHIGAELVQDKMFDASIGTKFFEFPISGQAEFTLTFKKGDFGGAKDAEELRAKAKKYFVNWGFKVKGQGFTDAYVEGGKTETAAAME